MIKAEFNQNNHKFIELASTANGKQGYAFQQSSGTWTMVYSNRAQKDGFESYQSVLDYLTKKGW